MLVRAVLVRLFIKRTSVLDVQDVVNRLALVLGVPPRGVVKQ